MPTATLDCTTNAVLKYVYGNQITHSYVTIFFDGSIVHEERVTAETTTVTEAPLTPTRISETRAQISAASLGTFSEVQGQPTSLGSEAGTFEACEAGTATGFVIRQVLRSPNPNGGNDTIVINGSPAAAPLLQLVQGYANRDMPLP